MISVSCPGCGASFKSVPEFAGRRVKCPKCATRFEHPPVSDVPSSTIKEPTANDSVQSLSIAWPKKPGVIIERLRAFSCGIGSEYVYCYTYPMYLEIAELKKEKIFKIKVGMAKKDPIGRIYSQVSASKTAQSEQPTVLLIFETLKCSHLERWLHKRLERAADAYGVEWFYTNPDRLLELFGEYLVKGCVAEIDDKDETRKRGDEGVTTSQFKHASATEATTQKGLPARRTGMHRRDETGRTAKDHVLEKWVRSILHGDSLTIGDLSDEYGVKVSSIRGWVSCWRSYRGNAFTGTEGWPKITKTMLNEVIAAITKANSLP